MIKSFTAEELENLKINVVLKSGKSFLGKDVPPKPLGEHERVISFWDDNAIMCFPMEQVLYFSLYTETNKP